MVGEGLILPGHPGITVSGPPGWTQLSCSDPLRHAWIVLGHEEAAHLGARIRDFLEALTEDPDACKESWIMGVADPLRALYYVARSVAGVVDLLWEKGADGTQGIAVSVTDEELREWVDILTGYGASSDSAD